MTSRERIMKAFQFREADRIPLDFSGHRSSGIAAMLYPKLREVLGLEYRMPRIYDPFQQLAVVDEDVLRTEDKGARSTNAVTGSRVHQAVEVE